MHKLLGNMINKFDAEAKNHLEKQSLNPFSGSYSRSPSPRLSKDQYGKPLAGSKTEERGQKAKCHILREIQDLCNCIHDLGVYNKSHKQKDDDSEDEAKEDEIIITFGEIFQMYTKINDKVVGLLIAAKKRGFIFFDREILFQRRDDDVLIALIKPIEQIRAIINKELAINSSPSAASSRCASPAVTDSSDSENVNGTISNGMASGSGNSKQGKNTSKKSSKHKKNDGQTNDETKNGLVAVVGKETDKKCETKENTVLPKKSNEDGNIMSEAKKNHTTNELMEINTTSTSLMSTESKTSINEKALTNNVEKNPEKTLEAHQENASSEEKLKANQGNLPQEMPQINESNIQHPVEETQQCNQNNVLPKEILEIKEENILPENLSFVSQENALFKTEPILELTDMQNSDGADGMSNTNQTLELAVNSIPTIEISEAGLEYENSENEEPLVAKTEEAKTNETDSFQSGNYESEPKGNYSSEISSDIKNLNENITVNDSILAEESKNDETLVSTDIAVDEISVSLGEQVLETVNSSNDGERKRTLSNEELIESVTAAFAGRGTSPDPCDEEVEQILLSQTTVSTILEESPSDKINDSELLVSNNSSSIQTPIKLSPCEMIKETPISTSGVIENTSDIDSGVEAKKSVNEVNHSSNATS